MSSSYQPAVGDTALIYDGTNEGVYDVAQMHPNGVYISPVGNPASLSFLQLTPQGWKVYGTDAPYQIHFHHKNRPTLPSWKVKFPYSVEEQIAVHNYLRQLNDEFTSTGQAVALLDPNNKLYSLALQQIQEHYGNFASEPTMTAIGQMRVVISRPVTPSFAPPTPGSPGLSPIAQVPVSPMSPIPSPVSPGLSPISPVPISPMSPIPSQPQGTVERAPDGTVYGQGCVTSLVGRSNEDRYVSGVLNGNIRFYVVFDGHGGKFTVNALKEQFPQKLAGALLNVNMNDQNAVQQAVQGAIEQFEAEVIRANRYPDGSTMVLALITDQYIYLVNLGDSRGILFNDIGSGYGLGSQPARIIAETIDHEPLAEKDRIEAAGGYITTRRFGTLTVSRVLGILAVSRAFGDLDLKLDSNDQYSVRGPVSLQADITRYSKTSSNPEQSPLFLLLASDGLFERVSGEEPTNQDIINEATMRFGMQGRPLSEIFMPSILPRDKEERDILSSCSRLAQTARPLATDDITVMIVKV